MAWTSETVWPLAYHLHAHESLGEKWSSDASLRETTGRSDRADSDRSAVAGLDLGEGSSRGNWRFKKNGPQAVGKSRGGWNTKIHLLAADDRTVIAFSLSPGNEHDAPHGRTLLQELGPMPEGLPLLIDRAFEGDETRQLVLDLGMIPVVPPKCNCLHPWD